MIKGTTTQNALSCLVACAILAASCGDTKKSDVAEGTYVKLAEYMELEIKRLQTQDPTVEKSVFNKDEGETKQLKIKDWAAELATFVAADINKTANKGLYKVENVDCKTTYTALEPNLHTQKIIVYENHSGKIDSLYIQKMTNNLLYDSQEELSYYPDSAYKIVKEQDIFVLGNKQYKIEGKIKKEL